jgi:hypothetical protein
MKESVQLLFFPLPDEFILRNCSNCLWLVSASNRPRKDSMTTAQNTNDLTRQQLDELDALLQKMLALPLNGPESSPHASPVAATVRSMVSEVPLPDALSTRTNAAATFTPPTPRNNVRESAPQEIWRTDSPSGPASIPQLLAIHSPSIPASAPATRKAPSSHQRPLDVGAPTSPLTEQLELPRDLVSNPFQMDRPTNPTPDQPQSLPTAVQPEPAMVEYVPAMIVPFVAFNRVLYVALGNWAWGAGSSAPVLGRTCSPSRGWGSFH